MNLIRKKFTTRNIYDLNTSFFLEKVFLALNKNQINFFLDSGSLLKTVRNKSLTIGSDFDIGLVNVDLKKIRSFTNQLKNKGFKFVKQSNFPIFCDQLRILYPRSHKGKSKHIDIHIYYKHKNFFILNRPHKYKKNSFLSKVLFFLIINFQKHKRIKKILFYFYNNFATVIKWRVGKKYFTFFEKKFIKIFQFNTKYMIPGFCDRYLINKYSSKWRFPDKSWKLKKNKDIFYEKLKLNLNNCNL